MIGSSAAVVVAAAGRFREPRVVVLPLVAFPIPPSLPPAPPRDRVELEPAPWVETGIHLIGCPEISI